MKSILFISISLLLTSLFGSLLFIGQLNSNRNVDWLGKINKSDSYSVEIYSGEGDYIGTVGYEKKFFTKLEFIPKLIVRAFISSEDKDFFRHPGYSISGMFRAAFKNVLHFGYRQGASTITQQLVRDIEKDNERTIQRKIREIFNAISLEKNLEKSGILEAYLNRIYLGYSYYGVASASQGYFGKDLNQLNLSEVSLLAAIVSAPSRYRLHSKKGLKKALKRRKYVLRRMFEDGYLTKQQVHKALKSVPRVVRYSSRREFGDILSLVASELKKKGLWDLKSQKMKVYLSILDSRQRAYKNLLKKWAAKINSKLEFSLIAIEKRSLKVQAIIGAKDYSLSRFNRALKTKRPIGNMVTYLLYGAAYKFNQQSPWLEKVPGSTWREQMDGHTMLSNHYIAKIGLGTVSDYLKKLGWRKPATDFSLSLGHSSHSLKDLTSYFAAYGAGDSSEPFLISKITVNGASVFHGEEVPSPQRNYSLAMKSIMMGLKPDWLPISYEYPAAAAFSDNLRNAWSVIDLGDTFLGIWLGVEDGVSRFSQHEMKNLVSIIYTDLTHFARKQLKGAIRRQSGLNYYWHPRLSTKNNEVFLPHLGTSPSVF